MTASGPVGQIEALLLEQRQAMVGRDLERLNAANQALALGLEALRATPGGSGRDLRRVGALLRGQQELVRRARLGNERALAALRPPQATYGAGNSGSAAAAVLRNTHVVA